MNSPSVRYGESNVSQPPHIPPQCAYCPNRRIDICGAVSDDDTALLEETKLSDRVYRAHSTIIQQGDENRQYYQIIDGWVALFHHDSFGVRKVLEILVGGDSFGHLTSDNPSSAFTAECLTDASVCSIPHQRLRNLVQDRPEIGLRVSELADGQRDRWHRHLIKATGGSALNRLSEFLSNLVERVQSRRSAGSDKPIVLPLRQTDIADALSLTQVYVNSLLKSLNNQNIINVGRAKLTILDVDALRRTAMQIPERNGKAKELTASVKTAKCLDMRQ